MMPILYVKGSTSGDVRLSKFISIFNKNGLDVYFIGWQREKNAEIEQNQFYKYIYTGGGYYNKNLILHYPIWMVKVFFYFLFKKDIKKFNIIAINFDVALPIYLVSFIRDFNFTYEIYDQFALSYNFSERLKKLLLFIDDKIIARAKMVIHVDRNRVKNMTEKVVIIENTPEDYYDAKPRTYDKIRHKFAVTGRISISRGINHILRFAKENPTIELLVVGDLNDLNGVELENDMQNITVKSFIPQKELFSIMESCCGIFSLYDPKLEINRLAASNKVYDAMMLGIPVITNKEVINSSFIKDNNIGYIVNYEFDQSWTFLSQSNFVEQAIALGKESRKIYLEQYLFNKLVEKKLIGNNLFWSK